MLEYFTYKKVKKHQAAKNKAEELKKEAGSKRPTSPSSAPAPLLNEGDEQFLTRVISAEGTPPPLPDRPSWWGPTAGEYTENDLQMILHETRPADNDENAVPEGVKDKGKGKVRAEEHEEADPKVTKKASRFSFLHRKTSKDKAQPLNPNPSVPADESTAEEQEIFRVLDDLNLSAVNNKAISLSKDSQALVQSFTFILKDLINGVPTAYDDLTHLLDDSQGTLAKSYDHLPKFLQKLITQLPTKMTSSIAPELLAAATKAQALSPEAAEAAGGSIAGAAKAFLTVGSLKELVTKPGAVIRMLKYIMNVLKVRWPAFMGTNVLLSLGLFVLLFVFWYCHKRGREVRLGKETPTAADGSTVIPPGERITTLEDDPMLPPNENHRPRSRRSEERNGNSRRSDERNGNGHSSRRSEDRGSRRNMSPRKEREREREKETAGSGRERRR